MHDAEINVRVMFSNFFFLKFFNLKMRNFAAFIILKRCNTLGRDNFLLSEVKRREQTKATKRSRFEFFILTAPCRFLSCCIASLCTQLHLTIAS